MFERLTAGARAVLVDAQDDARRLGHEWVGCEHLLLAVARSASPAGAALQAAGATPTRVQEAITTVLGPTAGGGGDDDKGALASLGIDLDEVRDAVERSFGPGALDARRPAPRRRLRRRVRGAGTTCQPVDRPSLTPRAKRCLELALREALRLKHDHVGVEHIALSLLSRDDTVAWRVLLHLGVVPADVGARIRESVRRTA